jgi:O-antigen/teichoic acid export membrane protein
VSLGVVIRILRERTNNELDMEAIKFGLHTSFVTFLTSLASTDMVIINKFLSPVDVAIYSIALVFPKQIKSLYGIFGQLFAPRIYKATSVTEAWEYLKDKFVILVGLFVLMGVAGFVAIPIFVPLLFSERYVNAVPYAVWLWLVMALTGPMVYLGNILTAQQKLRYVYGHSIVYYLLLFVLYLLLVKHGLMGIVSARIILYLISAIIRVASFFYYLKLSRVDA